MKCKKCGSKTMVIRTIRLENKTLRIRQCPRCKSEFTTEEKSS
ncbi:MAG: hypothetical protein PHC50_08565 [Candidatus Cloacimonetes bacterium]|nr:hypothetical protein [Candidatus Cloacimonadota bacterium]